MYQLDQRDFENLRKKSIKNTDVINVEHHSHYQGRCTQLELKDESRDIGDMSSTKAVAHESKLILSVQSRLAVFEIDC